MGGCHDVLTKEHKGESRSRYRLCIPPCPHYIKQAGYTQFVSGMIGSDWEWSMQSWLSRGPTARIVRASTAYTLHPWELSLRREFLPAFLTVPTPLPPRRSSGCARRNRRWIRWREWRRVSPYLLPFPSDPEPALWDRKPTPRFPTPPQRKGSTLHLSSSEEGDGEDVDELSQA